MRFRRREVACREAVDLMTDYLEGALSATDRVRFEAHLAECPYCVEYLDQIRAVIDLAGHLEPDDLPEPALEELVGLYRSWRTEMIGSVGARPVTMCNAPAAMPD